jgi:hypothetical protein
VKVHPQGSLQILSSHKRGGSWGVPINRPCLPTQSPMFLGTLIGLLSCFKFEKTGYSVKGLKKVGSFFDVECAAKTSEVRSDIVLQPMWRYRYPITHCRQLSYITTGGVSLRLFTEKGRTETKKNIFANYKHTPPVIEIRWRQWEYHHMGCSSM